MAVELRCPECRAKLRLPVTPEEGSEIECPKCGHVFPADGNTAGAARDDDGEVKPKKKTSRDDDGEPRKKKKDKGAATATKTDASGEPKKKKRRKLKKRETNTAVLVGAVIGGLLVLGIFIGAIVWFFTRKSASQEMMMYLPDDCDEVSGINLGHMQKYPEFYRSCEGTFANTGFKKAADAFSKALGQETNDTIAYVVQGVGRAGGSPSGQLVEATVLRTKTEYDTSLLSKLPGAQKGTRNGADYYSINDIPELGYGGLRVFAPTNRIVVFCRADTPPAKFDAMLDGNKDNAENCVFARSGQLGKQVIRATAWKFTVFNRSIPRAAPPAPPAGGGQQGGQESDDDVMNREIADILSTARGSGFKASVGSRDVRGEWIIWYKDSEAASNMLKKWKEKEWIKDEEQDPPRWWKSLAGKSGGGGKAAGNILRDGLGFRQRGETFIVRTAMETKLVGVSSVVGSVTNTGSSFGAGGGMAFPPGGGRPMPPGGGNQPRRRFLLTPRRGRSLQCRV